MRLKSVVSTFGVNTRTHTTYYQSFYSLAYYINILVYLLLTPAKAVEEQDRVFRARLRIYTLCFNFNTGKC